ncbi:TDP-N-acetylfucosamine:lipid II N-acetylfucosaminyltransferase family protein [Winogradskyella sp. PC D3.3]
MILHLIPAEKFTDRAIKIFENAYPGKNHFYVFIEDLKNLKFSENLKASNITIVNKEEKWWKNNFIDINKYQKLILHNLYSNANIYFGNLFSKKIETHGVIWGYEFYGIRNFWDSKNYGELTAQKKKELESSQPDFKKPLIAKSYLIKRAFKLLTSKKYRCENPTLEAKTNVFLGLDVIQTHSYQDYLNVKARFNINPLWSNFSYYSYEDYNIEVSDFKLDKKILVGNSATFTNNHLEVFEMLKDRVQDFEIICPLNYGDPICANFIREIGTDYFQEGFTPLMEFMQLEDYNKLQASCGIVIMNHYRQQAAGNIIAALIFGSKVFMSLSSPLFKHFQHLGIHIYSIENDLKDDNALKNLKVEYAVENRIILKKYYSMNTIVAAIKGSIKL